MEIVHYSEKLKQNVFSFTDACFSELGKKFEPEGRHAFYNNIEKAFEVEGEVLGDGEDIGNNFIVSLEDAQGDEAKVEFEFVDGTTKYTGTLVVDITTQGGATNDIIMFTGTFYVYGKPTKEVVSE